MELGTQTKGPDPHGDHEHLLCYYSHYSMILMENQTVCYISNSVGTVNSKFSVSFRGRLRWCPYIREPLVPRQAWAAALTRQALGITPGKSQDGKRNSAILNPHCVFQAPSCLPALQGLPTPISYSLLANPSLHQFSIHSLQILPAPLHTHTHRPIRSPQRHPPAHRSWGLRTVVMLTSHLQSSDPAP